MIVVDTNILVYFHLGGPALGAVERLWTSDPDWHAPALWRSEFCNVLAGYLRRGMSAADARRICRRAEAQLRKREHRVSAARVLTLAARSSCSAYDLEFVALAQQLGVPLVTTDRQVLREFPRIAQPLPAV
ncbi:MAG: type II toxin-antitoxin system VapC family toxin [Terriglobales bacterium]